MDHFVTLGVLAMPVLLGFVVWLIWAAFAMGLRATKQARNWWRRIRRKRLVGQRIEPTL